MLPYHRGKPSNRITTRFLFELFSQAMVVPFTLADGESKRVLAGFDEHATNACNALNINKNAFSYSKRFMEWLGFSEESKTLDEAYNYLPPEHRQLIADAIAHVIQPGSSGLCENEHPIINQLTEQIRLIHAQAQVFYDAAGKR